MATRNGRRLLPPPSAESHSRQESKLARVLQAYEESLAQHESAFLSMMCVFRFGATVELISSLIEKNQGRGMPRALAKSRKEDLETLATRLCDLNLIQRESETLLTVHPAVRDFFYQRLEQPQKLHAVVAMAFDDQLDITRARKLEELMVVWAELDRTYDIFILHVEDRNEHEKEMVREILASRRQLEKQLDKQIRHYLAKYGDREDPSLVDLFLQCRENIKMGERPILPDEEDIHITLHARPGRNEFPIDSKTLDMLEELIFHTIEAGQPQVAYDLYEHRMGGRNNLAKRLGQFDRGLRIMLAFHPCPNMHDLAWYYRGVGDIERARQVMDETERIWTGTIHCLQGNLKQANTGRYFGNTKDVASLLMGTFDRPFRPPLFGWGEVIVDADYFLLKGDYDTAFQVADEQLSEFKGDGWTRHMPEAIRCRMVMAEAECRRGRPRKAATQLSKAEPWIFSSGAVEFLCQYHLTNGRILMALDCPQQARTKLLEGLHLARSCGFSLYHIDFANEIGSWLLGQLRLDEAEDAATAALKGRRSVRNQSDAYIAFDCEEPRLAGAEDVGCSYAWGRARSHSLLGDIHAERRQWRTACQHLSICQTIESRIDHPDLNRTRKRLEYAKRQANSGD